MRSRPPHRLGGGFSFLGASRLVAAAAITVALVTGPASAAQVTVRFGLSVGTYAPTGAVCPVKVPAGANGVVVLKAAKAKHCIVSYKLESYSGLGRFVRCINGLCGIDRPVFLTYWAMYENGGYTPYGVDGFRANSGDELSFVYRR
jgi:hypothetical protein